MKAIDPSKLPLKAQAKHECKNELADLLWSDGFVCHACGNKKGYWLKSRQLYECANKSCKKQSSATAATQFKGCRKIEECWEVLRAARNTESTISTASIKNKTGLTHKSARRLKQRLEIFENNIEYKQQEVSKLNESSQTPTRTATPTGSAAMISSKQPVRKMSKVLRVEVKIVHQRTVIPISAYSRKRAHCHHVAIRCFECYRLLA